MEEARAGKCIVLLPPSLHTDGGYYEWILEPKGDIPLVSNVTEAGLHGPAPAASSDLPPVPPAVAEAIARNTSDRAWSAARPHLQVARRLKGVSGLDTSDAAMWSYIEVAPASSAIHWHERPSDHAVCILRLLEARHGAAQ